MRDTDEYDIVKDLYKLESVADNVVHFMTFEDVLSMLSSHDKKQARTHQACVIHCLARASHAVSCLGIGNLM